MALVTLIRAAKMTRSPPSTAFQDSRYQSAGSRSSAMACLEAPHVDIPKLSFILLQSWSTDFGPQRVGQDLQPPGSKTEFCKVKVESILRTQIPCVYR